VEDVDIIDSSSVSNDEEENYIDELERDANIYVKKASLKDGYN
jgi:hypothetical protein